MSEENPKTFSDFVLPPSVVSRRDVSRLVNELERVDNDLTTASVREKTGAEAGEHPTYSEQLSEFLEKNQLSLDDSGKRSQILHEMRQLKDKAPIIHMTFSVTADGESLQELSRWLRESVHPQAVIDVGLQPSLIAGVYVRTPNHVHDFSLHGALDGHRDILAKELEAIRVGQ